MNSLWNKVFVVFTFSCLLLLAFACTEDDTSLAVDDNQSTNSVQTKIMNEQDIDNYSQIKSVNKLQGIRMDGIYKDANSVQPLKVGEIPVIFTVRKADGAEVRITPNELTKPIVLSFFRGGWCPYCNRHLADMRTAEASLKDMGFDVWFMSIDKPELLYESLKEPNIGYTLFSDAELEATKALGIGFVVDDATNEKYLGYGINLSEASGLDHHVLPAPSTFILGEGGRVHFQYTNPDYTVRLDPEVLLAAAQAYVDSH